jgi:nitrogen fixation protein NifU and related proteins
MDFYREIILDHYKHPRNAGHLNKPDIVMEEGNVTCGDKIIMEICVSTSPQLITDIAFSGEGCAISQASASMLSEKVKGQSIEFAMRITPEDIQEMLGTTLTPSRMKCALLALEVLQKAIVSLKK